MGVLGGSWKLGDGIRIWVILMHLDCSTTPEYGLSWRSCVDFVKPVESDSLDLDLEDRQREYISHVFLMDMEKGKCRGIIRNGS